MEKITKSSDKVLIDPNEPLILPDGTALVGRVEWFLYALCCLDYQNLPTPMSRIEEFANALITGEVPNIEPQSRAEQFFLAILDGNVSDLPQPQSRSEVLLDKLARGEFDLSDVEPIQSRYELLLAYLIKNGGIGNIDYVLYEFSEAMKTMYNTVEKPFKSLELSGNTLVNCVLEDTENDDYTSFDKDYSGTSFTINGTSEGAIKSAILKGETLVNLMNENERFNASLDGTNPSYWAYKYFTLTQNLKPSTNYTLIFNATITQSHIIHIGGKPGNAFYSTSLSNVANGVNKFLLKTYSEITDKEMNKLFIQSNNSKLVEITLTDFILVEGDYTNTDIPYFTGMQSVKLPVLTTSNEDGTKTNILSTPEDLELRGIGDVKDTVNCLTGEVVENTIKLTFSGIEKWEISTNLTNYMTFRLAKPSNMITADSHSGASKYMCDKLQIVSSKTAGSTEIEAIWFSPGHTYIRLPKAKASSLEEFKTYLSTNNIQVVSCAKNPIIKTVDLNVVDQNNTKIDKIHVFDEVTHVNASSDELTPTVNIGKSVSYPTIIKPNTKYTVDLKRNDKPLTVNLGGTEVTFVDGETRKTITTPSTLTNDKLSYYGIGAKCNEIMLIEGEIERNIDYFTGMQSVVMQNQMPILHTVGKNLFDGVSYIDGFIANSNNYIVSPDTDVTSIIFNVNKNTDYILSAKTNFNRNIIGGSVQPITIGTKTTKIEGYRVSNTLKFNSGEFTNIIIYLNSSKIDIEDIQVEEGTVATTYEPYKSSILSCNDDVTLRGIGDVQDTLDLTTGELTERIGEIVLDGTQSNVGYRSEYSNDDYYCFMYDITKNGYKKAPSSPIGISCPIPFQQNRMFGWETAKEFVLIDGNDLVVKLLKSRLSNDNSISTLNTYLASNPITINYPLMVESIKTVDLNVVDQDGNTIPKIKSYNGVTHLEVTVPKQSLLPHISAEVATDNSKDMSSLTTKHQEISETQSVIENNIQSQSDEIDTALMATTEIFESILE